MSKQKGITLKQFREFNEKHDPYSVIITHGDPGSEWVSPFVAAADKLNDLRDAMKALGADIPITAEELADYPGIEFTTEMTREEFQKRYPDFQEPKDLGDNKYIMYDEGFAQRHPFVVYDAKNRFLAQFSNLACAMHSVQYREEAKGGMVCDRDTGAKLYPAPAVMKHRDIQ